MKNPNSLSLTGFLIQDRTVIFFIVANSLALYLDAFPAIHQATGGLLSILDYLCTVYFIVEVLIKVKTYGWRAYWMQGWNRFDFTIVTLSLPSLLGPVLDTKVFSSILILRLARLVRFFRMLRFIPNGRQVLDGVLRSLKASVGVFAALFILNTLMAMGATLLFSDLAPEYFGHPLRSSYSLFKVFTIEGWYDIPDILAQRSDSFFWSVLLRGYFVLAVIVGGILGLSLANAVFVNEMTCENNIPLEKAVEGLRRDLDHLKRQNDRLREELLKALDGRHSVTADSARRTFRWPFFARSMKPRVSMNPTQATII